MSVMNGSQAPAPLTGVVPMIDVADVERSAEFYRLLGFEIGNYVPRTGTKGWAWLYSPGAPDWKRAANLMIRRAEEPIDNRAEAVLFYLYAVDATALRERLLAHGINASEITYPEYLPQGEFRVVDPDGYTLMIAQSGPTTP